MLKANKVVALLLAGLLGSTSTFAQQESELQFYSTDQTADIDGELDESVWQTATKVNLGYNINPGDNTPAPVKTEMMLFENGKSVFIAFKAYDPNPKHIRAYYRDRDTIFQDDFVGVVLDTFNDERRAYEFFVNAYGVQGDLIKDDSNGGREDSSWDAIWDSAGKITDDGYIVEMEIPYSALRFPGDVKDMVWGIDALRIYPRDSRMVLSNNKSLREIDCHLCQISKIGGLKDLKQGNNLQLTPTLTTSRSDNKDELPGEWQAGDADADAGVDLRWGINQNLYLNATINPDFSQVEADAAQLDINNTFSLFLQEKRPFFLDGKDYFDTQRMRLVHTRNIADPDYGMKLTGKNGDHTYGFLIANDQSTSYLLPGSQGSSIAEEESSSQAMIGRYRIDVGERSNIGVLVTDRQNSEYQNSVMSVDGRHQFDKANSLSYQIAYSDSSNSSYIQDEHELAANQQDQAYSVRYRHSKRNYNAFVAYDNYGEDFRADLGFVGKVNFERAVVGGQYTWFGEEGSKWTRWGLFGDWDKTYDHQGNMLEEEVEMHANIQGPKQFSTNFGVVQRNSLWENEYYDVTNLMAFASFYPTADLRLWMWTRGGDQIDYSNDRLGDGFIFETGANIKLGKHLSSEVKIAHNSLDIDQGNVYTANQFEVRMSYQFNLNSFLRFNVRYTDIDRNAALYLDDDVNSMYRKIGTELLYAYKLNPQSLLYLGYTDQGFQEDGMNSIEKDNRKVFMKFSYAWQM